MVLMASSVDPQPKKEESNPDWESRIDDEGRAYIVNLKKERAKKEAESKKKEVKFKPKKKKVKR